MWCSWAQPIGRADRQMAARLVCYSSVSAGHLPAAHLKRWALTMFSVAFLQELGNGRLRIEEQMLKSEFERRGVPVELYTIKRIQRRRLPLSKDTFIAGDMDAMHGAMKQLEIDIPKPNDYPRSLVPFLHRHIWKSTLLEAARKAYEGECSSIFVKPSSRRKNFTGTIIGLSHDHRQFGSVSRRQEVWCSDVVRWKSEFRVYVVEDAIVGVDHYEGDPEVVLNMHTVELALVAYRNSGEAPSAYGIDFGVLESGETALVEANDGYALGAYKVGAEPYTNLLIRRWEELLCQVT